MNPSIKGKTTLDKLTTPTITITKGTSNSATQNPSFTTKHFVDPNPTSVTAGDDYSSSTVTDETETNDGSGDDNGSGDGSGDGENEGSGGKKKKKVLGHDRYGLRCYVSKICISQQWLQKVIVSVFIET